MQPTCRQKQRQAADAWPLGFRPDALLTSQGLIDVKTLFSVGTVFDSAG